ncbi:MAG: sugar ABC transporter substrate-binding protein [Acidimicrobiales bacterium]
MPSLNRRSVLKLGAAGAATLLSADLIAACGDSDAGPTALDPNGLKPFDSTRSKATATGLPPRVAWASTAGSEFFLDLARGMEQAAAERGVDYVTATSGNDPAKHVEQMNDFLAKGVGAMAMQPLNPDADSVALKRAIDNGVCTQGIITAPSTIQVVASQYQIGYDQGKAAADYVRAELGGNAKVLYFNLDSASPQLRIRHNGVRDGLATGGGGLEVVGDLTVADISTTSGFNTMMSALQTYSDIKVVLGGDTIVVGAFKALKESGKLTDDMFLAGVDGDKEALELIKAGGAYKLSIAFAWTLMGYGLAQFGADWIEGKDVPRLIVARGVKLDSGTAVSDFATASAEPATIFADRDRYENYLPLYGNVSYRTRFDYWTSAVDPPAASTGTR